MAQARKAGRSVWGWTWSHSDHLGRSTVITDNDGKVVRRLAYTPFGEEVVNAGTGEKPPSTYTGKELDASGLLYYGARYYDPVLGRFITPDTVSDAGTQGLNRYSYALNHPIRYTDPSGHLSYAADQNPKLWDGPPTLSQTPSSATYLGDGISVALDDGPHVVPPTYVDILEQAEIGATPKRSLLRTNPLSRYLGDVLMFGTSIVAPKSDWASCNAITRACYTPKEAFDTRFSTFIDLATSGVMKAATIPFSGSVKALPASRTSFGSSLNEVARFVFKEGKLPDNFITKDAAKALGWKPKLGNLWNVASGKSIGGDVFKNLPVNGIKPLPEVPGRIWYEADLNYHGGLRGSERLLYSNDGLIYYTGDHYNTFQMMGNR